VWVWLHVSLFLFYFVLSCHNCCVRVWFTGYNPACLNFHNYEDRNLLKSKYLCMLPVIFWSHEIHTELNWVQAGNWHQLSGLTLILLTWRIWWASNNTSRWQMGINSLFKGLKKWKDVFQCGTWRMQCGRGMILVLDHMRRQIA
jgi:hypothetical protein